MRERKNMDKVKGYDFHEWWSPCSDPRVGHIFPKWPYETKATHRRAVCGQDMGGGANGTYEGDQLCQSCLDKIAKTEDKILLRLVKKNRKFIISLLKQIRSLAEKAPEVIGFWPDKDEE